MDTWKLFLMLALLSLATCTTKVFDFTSSAYPNEVSATENDTPPYGKINYFNYKPNEGWCMNRSVPTSFYNYMNLYGQYDFTNNPSTGLVTAIETTVTYNLDSCTNCTLELNVEGETILLQSWINGNGNQQQQISLLKQWVPKRGSFQFNCHAILVTQDCIDATGVYFTINRVSIEDGKKKQDVASVAAPIGGGVGGVIIIIVAIIVIIVVVRKRKNKRLQKERENKEKHDSIQLEKTSSTNSVEIVVKKEETVGDKIDDIKIANAIGSGAFGEVFLGIWQSDTKVALKKITGGQIDEFNKEANILYKLHHPNIIRYLGLHISKSGDTYMVMEFAQKGSLKDFLKAEKSTLTIDEKYELMISTAKGMVYLESKQIIHRDLAARNVLVSVVDGKFQCKISDFGLSRVASEYKLHGQAIPFRWSPPELLKDEKATPKSDVWSFGIVLHEILENGDLPYIFLEKNVEVRQYVLEGRRLPQSSNCNNPSLYKLMLACWQENGDDRPSFKEVLNTLKILSPETDSTPKSVHNGKTVEAPEPIVYNYSTAVNPKEENSPNYQKAVYN